MALITIQKVVQKIAKEQGISIDIVTKIVNSQFKFVKDTMALGEKNRPETFKTIQVTHLGKFAVRKKKIEQFRNLVKMSVPKGKKFNKNYTSKEPKHEKH